MSSSETPKNAPYKNSQLPIEERIEDLLGRMTLREKVRQMDQYHGCSNFADRTFPTHHTAMAKDGHLLMDKVEELIGEEGIGCIHDIYPPDAEPINQLQKFAVERTRLGIPILFSEEGLHGLCGPGNTIFPQAISMAGTWNRALVKQIGHAIGRELRAYGVHETFSPVLDIAREPRWGRVEETFGEDTWLNSRMGVAIISGMQGEDLTADDAIVAEPKHFVAYGQPRAGLNCAPAHMGERELRTVHLPTFEAAFQEAGALGCMVSYNSIDGIPCSGNRWLLYDLLRGEWGFEGFVRSDLGALRKINTNHRAAATPEEAIRQSVHAGLDLQYYDYDNDFYQETLIKLVESGSLAMEDIDRAVSSILRVKFKLGLFENPYTEAKLHGERVRCQEHLDLSLETARQTMCLMKNEGSLLPLDKNPGTIAVIGPSADKIQMGDYTPTVWGFETVSVLDGIRAKVSAETKVLHAKGTGFLAGELESVPAECLQTPEGKPGLRGEYFNNLDFEGEPVLVREDRVVNFDWAFTTPAAEVNQAAFSVRWRGKLKPTEDFTGYLGVSSLDEMRLQVNGEMLVDGFGRKRSDNINLSAKFTFEAGREYDLVVEFRKIRTGVQVLLGWNQVEDNIREAVETAEQADVVVLCVGDSRESCGEARDRWDLNLPGNQLDLVKAIHATGKPVVMVLQAGRPMTIGWEAEHIPAILNAWFPGERGGTAIAEALFGEINPAGRLPVTYPKTLGQVPLHYNWLPFGPASYIDGDRDPLFHFGHGLSYTQFEYSNLRVSPEKVEASPESKVEVLVDVKNVGKRSGDEVAQCYVHDEYSSVIRPMKELAGFERVGLAPGETKTVRFELGWKNLRLWSRENRWMVEPGSFKVMVGGTSEKAAVEGGFEVT